MPIDSQRHGLNQSMSTLRVGSSSGASVPDNDINHALRKLTEYCSQLSQITCRQCRTVLCKGLDLDQHIRTWSTAARHPESNKSAVLSHVVCSKCQTITCIGRGGKPSTSGGKVTAGLYTFSSCCDQGRLASVWILLCWSDHRAQQQLLKEKTASKAPSQFQGGMFGGPQKKGTGYGGGLGHGFGAFGMYAGYSGETLKLKEADRKVDSLDEDVITILTALSPSIDARNGTRYDREPPSALNAIILLSSVLETVGKILRNDSIEDAVKRKGVYYAALDCAERLGAHPSTTALITQERQSKNASAGLYAISSDGGASSLELSNPKEGKASSVAAAMENIVSLAGTMNAASGVMRGEFEDSESKVQLQLCKRITKVIQTLYSAAPHGVFTTTKAASQNPALQRLNDYQRSNRTTVVNDALLQPLKVHQKKAAQWSQWGQPGHRRTARLVGEIGSMMMSLPDGIFVRAGGTRPDHMRVAVLGPEGTPYFGGIYEFDVLCGPSYPQGSPSVMWRVFGGVTVQNPNLHDDGEVCLSLLGTWQGAPMENWQPHISTLYQVLVSLQSFIFTANPGENDPTGGLGRGDVGHKFACVVQAGAVAGYVLPWLTGQKRDPWSAELWGELARRYYAVYGSRILRAVQQSSARNPFLTQTAMMPFPLFGGIMGANPGMGQGRNLVKELETALRRVGVGT